MSGRIAYRKCIKKFIPIASSIVCLERLKKGIIYFKTINNSYMLCLFLFIKLNSFQVDKNDNLLKFILFSSFEKKFSAFQEKYKLPEKFEFNESFIENIKAVFNANICIFHESHEKFYPIYKTQKLINSKCIKLLLTEENTFSLIIRNFDLEKKFSIFCEICLKSYQRKSIRSHKCLYRKCLICFEQDCEPDEMEPKQVCPQCFKRSNSNKCFEIHQQLTKTECKSTTQCHKCLKIFRGNLHQCGKRFCKACFSLHNEQFCSLNKVTLPRTYFRHFICLAFSNTLFLIGDLHSTFVCLFNRQTSRQMYYKVCPNGKLVLENTLTCFKLDFFDIMKRLDISGPRKKFFCDEDFFSYISQNLDCTFQFKKGQLTECLNTFGLFCKIEAFVTIHPVLIWYKNETESINPLFLKPTKEMLKTRSCKIFNFDDYLDELYFNDSELFSKLYSFKHLENDIKQCSYLQFGKNNLNYRLSLYKIAFKTLKSTFKAITESQKIVCKNNFQCFDFSSLAAIGKFFWDNSLLNENLPILPNNLDCSLKCSSKVEICFAKAFIKSHKCDAKFIKSFVSNDGRQFHVDKLSSDIVSRYTKYKQ